MSNEKALNETFRKQKRNQKMFKIFFIISIVLIVAAVLTVIIAYIEANEFIKLKVKNEVGYNPSNEEIKNVIAARVHLPKLISIIVGLLSIAGAIIFKKLNLKEERKAFASEVQLKDSTENKKNLYD